MLGAPDDSAAAREILVNARFPAWLCSEEDGRQIILLETDAKDRQWTEACIRQADQILTVALAGESPELSDVESRRVYRPQRAGEAVSIANQKLTIQRMADYYIRMPVEEIGLFAFGALPRLEQIGYEHARQKILEWEAEGRWIRTAR